MQSAGLIIKTGIEDKAAWDDYVRQNPGGTLFHLSGWLESVEETLNVRSLHLVAYSGGKIAGALPLALCRGLFFKKMLISSPFATYGGILFDGEQARKALLEKAIALAKERGAEYLELRNQQKAEELSQTKALYVAFKKELPKDPKLCLNMLPRKARAEARHAIDKGLTTTTGLDRLAQCHRLYAINSKRLGSPFLPLAFFKKLAEKFKDSSTVLSVQHQGKDVASVFVFYYKDTIMPLYSGGLFEHTKYGSNNLMYLRAMELGSEKGCKYFDFGRSRKDSGPYNFKLHQGFEPSQLYYQFYFNKAKNMPNLNPSNPKLEIFKVLWRGAPDFITNKLGPFLVRFVP